MGMGDCVKCWNALCTCGYEYRLMSWEKRIELAAVILGVSPNILKAMPYIPKEHPRSKEA